MKLALRAIASTCFSICQLNLGLVRFPWTDALEVACTWAAGASCADEAATRLTNELYRIGKTRFQYSPGAKFAYSKFKCMEFLALLNGTNRIPQTLNCDDCATIVSTFANILGSNLSQSLMGFKFKTNPVLVIGSHEWGIQPFAYHSVAWKGDCTAEDSLFDACLQVDGDGNPSARSRDHAALQPANMLFGSGRNRLYRFCLVESGNCEPSPRTKVKRPIGKGQIAMFHRIDDDLLAVLKGHYSFDDWKHVDVQNQRPTQFENIVTYLEAMSGSNIQWDKNEDERSQMIEVLAQPFGVLSQLTAMNFYYCRTSVSPHEFLITLLGEFETLNFKRLTNSSIGQIVFFDEEAHIIIWQTDRFIGVIRSVGRDPVDVVSLASSIASVQNQ